MTVDDGALTHLGRGATVSPGTPPSARSSHDPLRARRRRRGGTRRRRRARLPNGTSRAPPSSRTTTAGGSVVYDVAVGAISGFAGDVTLALSGLSPVQASWSSTPATVTGSGTAHLAVTTAAGLAPGTYALTVTGTGGGTSHSAAVSLVVAPPPDFTLAATPSSRTTAAGGSVTFTISAGATGGFTGDIAL